MTGTFYWHDYETWGANPAVDRPSQFAGIRTNMDLDIIGDPLMMYCKPIEDLLPSPDACLVTGITPQQAASQGISEPEFIRKIHQEFSQPQTCVVGYNNIRFDDEVTRYTLYRNFYDPYAREWQNGNSRWDIIDMVRLTYAMRPNALQWPESEPGIPSFRLELLSAANQLAHESAHDALSDVIATIELAKRIKQSEPGLFDFYFKARQKQVVARQLDLESHKPLVHISSKIPASRGCTTLIMPLVMHPKNKNAVICVDLCADIQPLFELDQEQLRSRLYTSHQELGDLPPVPLKAVHLNKCPVLLPLKMLESENAQRLKIDRALAEQRWQKILNAEQITAKARFAFESDFQGDSDVDAALYQGFLSDADRRSADAVRNASPDDLVSQQFIFEDSRMPELLMRYKARHYPETLSQTEKHAWKEQQRERFLKSQEQLEGLSELAMYKRLLSEKKAELEDRDKILVLDALAEWAESRESLFASNP